MSGNSRSRNQSMAFNFLSGGGGDDGVSIKYAKANIRTTIHFLYFFCDALVRLMTSLFLFGSCQLRFMFIRRIIFNYE